MVWYSPELDEIIILLIDVSQDVQTTEVKWKPLGSLDMNDDKFHSTPWFYIGVI